MDVVHLDEDTVAYSDLTESQYIAGRQWLDEHRKTVSFTYDAGDPNWLTINESTPEELEAFEAALNGR